MFSGILQKIWLCIRRFEVQLAIIIITRIIIVLETHDKGNPIKLMNKYIISLILVSIIRMRFG